MLISNCCGEPAGDLYEYGLCQECKEHCEWIDSEKEDDDE